MDPAYRVVARDEIRRWLHSAIPVIVPHDASDITKITFLGLCSRFDSQSTGLSSCRSRPVFRPTTFPKVLNLRAVRDQATRRWLHWQPEAAFTVCQKIGLGNRGVDLEPDVRQHTTPLPGRDGSFEKWLKTDDIDFDQLGSTSLRTQLTLLTRSSGSIGLSTKSSTGK